MRIFRLASLALLFPFVALAASPANAQWAYSDRNELLSYPTVTFQYDLAGSTTQKVDAAGTWTYEWDVENRLARVLKNGAEVARYEYDPLSRRIEKVAGTTTKTYTYDGEDILREASSTGTTLTYLHGPGIR